MKALQIDEKNARTFYKSASPEFKAALVDTFGQEFFSQKITDRIKTFADACEATGQHPSFIESRFEEELSADEVAYMQLKIIAEALNEGWKADWNNSSQYKWAPWFYLNQPGFRFGGSVYDITDAGTAGGSRLCFKSEELADYAGKQFLEIYKQFLN